MATPSIDAYKVGKRLKRLYSHWRKQRDELWGSCNAFAVAMPPNDDDRYLKSSSLSLWLLGYVFTEMIMVFSDRQIHFLCRQKKALLLDVVKKSAKGAGVDVVMHVMAKGEDGSTQMESILRAIESLDSPVLGLIRTETHEGKLLKKLKEKLNPPVLPLSDITNGLADLFAVKKDDELEKVRKAAIFTDAVMKRFVVPKLEKVIDERTKVTHFHLAVDTEKVILNPTKIDVKIKAEFVKPCYSPIFQSGWNFDLGPSASSNDDHLYYGSASVIICALGFQYKSYCSNLARTFLIDPNVTQSKAYWVLLKAHEAALGALIPGTKASSVYEAALAVVEKEAPELTANLTKSAGSGIGLEFHELRLRLNQKNEIILQAGMVLNVSLGFKRLQSKSSKATSQDYALLLADTVIVTATGHEVVTGLNSKAIEGVAYFFSDGEQEADKKLQEPDKTEPDKKLQEPDIKSQEPEKKLQVKVYSRRKEALDSKATSGSDNHEMSKEELRRQHQAELARQQNEETEEEGKKELEREASNADREKGVVSDGEEEHKRRS